MFSHVPDASSPTPKVARSTEHEAQSRVAEVKGQAAWLEMLEGQAHLATGRAGANSGHDDTVMSATDAVMR